jgi:flagellar biosynthesis protein FlhA
MKYVLRNLIAVFIVFVVVLFIIPLPVHVLDFMFMLNIAVSFVIMLISMYIRETLELPFSPP